MLSLLSHLRIHYLYYLLLLGLFSCCPEKRIKVACVGDNITVGSHRIDASQDSWPSMLGNKLGDNYEVMNFGVEGATIHSNNPKAYIKSSNYRNVCIYQPDIIILMLGSNDANPDNWENYFKQIREDYENLLKTFVYLPSSPHIFVCTPICSFQNESGVDDYTVSQKLSAMIREVSRENRIDLIDMNLLFPINQSLFSDNLHPVPEGNEIIAEEIMKRLTVYGTSF